MIPVQRGVGERTRSSIERWEWMMWQWHEVGVYADKESMFVRGQERKSDDVTRAGKEWDSWQETGKA